MLATQPHLKLLQPVCLLYNPLVANAEIVETMATGLSMTSVERQEPAQREEPNFLRSGRRRQRIMWWRRRSVM